MKEYGLERGRNGLRVVMMCEIPSNAILADAFLEHFDLEVGQPRGPGREGAVPLSTSKP